MIKYVKTPPMAEEIIAVTISCLVSATMASFITYIICKEKFRR